MKLSDNSVLRLREAHRMVKTGTSVQYAAGMYSLPASVLEEWIASLSKQSPTEMVEIKKPECYAPKAVGHSTSDIFPYIIVIVGSFVDGFTYHITGQGLHIGDDFWGCYKHAHDQALNRLK